MSKVFRMLAMAIVVLTAIQADANLACRMAMRNAMHHHRVNNLMRSPSRRAENSHWRESSVNVSRERTDVNYRKCKEAMAWSEGQIVLSIYSLNGFTTLIPPYDVDENWEVERFSVEPGWLVFSEWIKERPDRPQWSVIYRNGAVYEFSFIAD